MPLIYAPGSETQVNTTWQRNQDNPAIAALTGGGYVVVWRSDTVDGSGPAIFTQLFDATGVPVGGETQVNTTTADSRVTPSVSGLSNGGYVVTWTSDWRVDDGPGVYARIYDASGAAMGGETLLSSGMLAAQWNPSVAAFSDGGFVVAWERTGPESDLVDIYQSRFDRSGAMQDEPTRVNTTTAGNQMEVDTAVLADGSYIVIWKSKAPSSSIFASFAGTDEVYAQRYNASGLPIGSEMRVDALSTVKQNLSITALSGGGYVVTWASAAHLGGDYDIFARHIDASGVAVGVETRVNTTTANWQLEPSITALSDGGYVVTWCSYIEPGNVDVLSRRYDASGTAVGDETSVNGYQAGSQSSPAITTLTDGSYVVAWVSTGPTLIVAPSGNLEDGSQDGSGSGICSKLYKTIDDSKILTVAADTDFTSHTLHGVEGIIFNGARTAVFNADQFDMQQISWKPEIVGDQHTNAIIVNKTDANPFLPDGWTFSNWTDGVDSITINGTDEAEFIFGTTRSDIIVSGGGTDTLYGSSGTDTVRYMSDRSQATITGYVSSFGVTIDGVTDHVVDIELVDFDGATYTFAELQSGIRLGTSNGDNLVGNSGIDVTDGRSGADSIQGLAGNDTLYGNAGNDTLRGGDDADQLWGGDANDLIWGDQGDDVLLGELGGDALLGDIGNDVLYGWFGHDVLFGWFGNDVLWGEQDGDSLKGEDGDDTMIGGLGRDTMTGGAGADRFYSANFEIAAGEVDIVTDYDTADRYLFQPGAQIQYFNFNAPGYGVGAGIHVQLAGGVFILDVFGANASQLQAQTLFF